MMLYEVTLEVTVTSTNWPGIANTIHDLFNDPARRVVVDRVRCATSASGGTDVTMGVIYAADKPGQAVDFVRTTLTNNGYNLDGVTAIEVDAPYEQITNRIGS